ncbi:50S ribosomal protein L35 [Candidatus Woesebacteria bacterium]|jgi:large subunit ribosomal protein L35|nr:50S ribosomal protein L35 [Candidatus Woesebacteria bacterium]
MKTKLKTRNAATKRFKVTGTGKILHRGHGVRHLKSNKSNRRLRAQKIMKEVFGVQKEKIKKMLGI